MIHKSHSKNDLIDLINTINLPITNAVSDNKKSIQSKIISIFNDDLTFDDNVYKINNTNDLKTYLETKTPKRSLNVKEKKNVMIICKKVVFYCTNGYCLMKSHYDTEQELDDDMLYISQYGDLPSVRRACKLMNENIMSTKKYEPLISPHVLKELEEKQKLKVCNKYVCQFIKGPITITFD